MATLCAEAAADVPVALVAVPVVAAALVAVPLVALAAAVPPCSIAVRSDTSLLTSVCNDDAVCDDDDWSAPSGTLMP